MVDTIYVHAVIIYPSPEASQDLALAYLWPRLAPFYHFKNCLFQGSLFHNPSHPHMQPYLTLRVHLRQFQHILLLLEYALFLPCFNLAHSCLHPLLCFLSYISGKLPLAKR